MLTYVNICLNSGVTPRYYLANDQFISGHYLFTVVYRSQAGQRLAVSRAVLLLSAGRPPPLLSAGSSNMFWSQYQTPCSGSLFIVTITLSSDCLLISDYKIIH